MLNQITQIQREQLCRRAVVIMRPTIRYGIQIPGLEPLLSVKYNRISYFTFITVRSKQQGVSALLTRLQVFISEGNSTKYLYTISVPRTENQRLVEASASSLLEGGDWSHMKVTTPTDIIMRPADVIMRPAVVMINARQLY